MFLAAADASRAAYTELLDGLEAKFADVAERDAAPQAGAAGGPGGAAERHRDPHRRDRQLPGLAALHRHARQRARRRGDPRAGHRLPARAAAASRRRCSPTSTITALADGTEVATSPLATEA